MTPDASLTAGYFRAQALRALRCSRRFSSAVIQNLETQRNGRKQRNRRLPGSPKLPKIAKIEHQPSRDITIFHLNSRSSVPVSSVFQGVVRAIEHDRGMSGVTAPVITPVLIFSRSPLARRL